MNEQQTSISALFGDVGRKFVALIRADAGVFRAEMQQKVNQGISSGLWLAIAALALLFAFALALTAVVLMLISLGLQPPVAAGIMAIVTGVLGWLAAQHGLAQMRSLHIRPDRTLAQLRENANLFKMGANDA